MMVIVGQYTETRTVSTREFDACSSIKAEWWLAVVNQMVDTDG